jgi:hypothetical protein
VIHFYYVNFGRYDLRVQHSRHVSYYAGRVACTERLTGINVTTLIRFGDECELRSL